MRSRGLVGEDALAPRLLEGGKLQVGILVFGRNSRIADVHEPVLSLIYGTDKPLIYQGLDFASKILSSDRCVRLSVGHCLSLISLSTRE